MKRNEGAIAFSMGCQYLTDCKQCGLDVCLYYGDRNIRSVHKQPETHAPRQRRTIFFFEARNQLRSKLLFYASPKTALVLSKLKVQSEYYKLQSGCQTHGLRIHRKYSITLILQNKNEHEIIPTIALVGDGVPSFRFFFREKFLPLSCNAFCFTSRYTAVSWSAYCATPVIPQTQVHLAYSLSRLDRCLYVYFEEDLTSVDCF